MAGLRLDQIFPPLAEEEPVVSAGAPLGPPTGASVAEDPAFVPLDDVPLSEVQKAYRWGLRRTSADADTVRAGYNALVGDIPASREAAAASAATLESAEKYRPRVTSLREIERPEDALTFIQNMSVSQLPSIVGMMGAGALAGTPKLAGLAVGALGGTQALTGNLPEDLAGVADQNYRETFGKSAVEAAGEGALSVVPGLMALKRSGLLPVAKREVVRTARDALRFMGKETGKQALAEGAEETAASALHIAAQNWMGKNVEFFDDKALDQYLESFAGGAAAGVGLGAATAGRVPSNWFRKIGELAGKGAEKLEAGYLKQRAALKAKGKIVEPGQEMPDIRTAVNEASTIPGSTMADRMNPADVDRLREAFPDLEGSDEQDVFGGRINEIADNLTAGTDEIPIVPTEGEKRYRVAPGKLLSRLFGIDKDNALELEEYSDLIGEFAGRGKRNLKWDPDEDSFAKAFTGYGKALSKEGYRKLESLSGPGSLWSKLPGEARVKIVDAIEKRADFFRQNTKTGDVAAERGRELGLGRFSQSFKELHGGRADKDIMRDVFERDFTSIDKGERGTALHHLIDRGSRAGVTGAVEARNLLANDPKLSKPESVAAMKTLLNGDPWYRAEAGKRNFPGVQSLLDAKYSAMEATIQNGLVNATRPKVKGKGELKTVVDFPHMVAEVQRTMPEYNDLAGAVAETYAMLHEAGYKLDPKAFRSDSPLMIQAASGNGRGAVYLRDLMGKEFGYRVTEEQKAEMGLEGRKGTIRGVKEYPGKGYFDPSEDRSGKGIPESDEPPPPGQAPTPELHNQLRRAIPYKDTIWHNRTKALLKQAQSGRWLRGEMVAGSQEYAAKALVKHVLARSGEVPVNQLVNMLHEFSGRKGEFPQRISDAIAEVAKTKQGPEVKTRVAKPTVKLGPVSRATQKKRVQAFARQNKTRKQIYDLKIKRDLTKKAEAAEAAEVGEESGVKAEIPTDEATVKGTAAAAVAQRIQTLARGARLSSTGLQKLLKDFAAQHGITKPVGFTYVHNPKVFGAKAPPLFGRVVQKDGQYHIYINPSLRGTQAISVVAHEFGHVIQHEMLRKASDATKTALLNDFSEYAKKNLKATDNAMEAFVARAPVAMQVLLGDHPALIGNLNAEQTRYVTAFGEWFADNVARELTTSAEPKSIVRKFFKSVANALEKLYKQFSAGEYAPAPSVQQFMKELRTSTAVNAHAKNVSFIRTLVDALYQSIKHGIEFGKQAAESTMKGTVQKQGKPLPSKDKAVAGAQAIAFESLFGTEESRSAIMEAIPKLDRAHRKLLETLFSTEFVAAKLRVLLAKDPVALKAIDDNQTGILQRIAYGHELWRAGLFNYHAAEGPLRSITYDMAKSMGILSKTELAEKLLIDIKAGETAKKGYNVFEQETVKRGMISKMAVSLSQAWHNNLVPLANKVYATSIYERLRETLNPHIIEFANKFMPPTGAKTGDIGMFRSRHAQVARFYYDFAKIWDPMTPEQREKISAAFNVGAKKAPKGLEAPFAALRRQMETMRLYGQRAGLKIPHRENFWPIRFKPELVVGKQADLEKMFAENYEADMRAKMIELQEATAAKDPETGKIRAAARVRINKFVRSLSKEKLANMFTNMLKGPEFTHMPAWNGAMTPGFTSEHQQVHSFIYSRANKDHMALLNSVRETDLPTVFNGYAYSLANKAEYSRRFPSADSFESYILKAKEAGATKEQEKLMRDYASAMMGSYGTEMRPMVAKLVKGLDTAFGSDLSSDPKKVRELQGWIATYQNLRTLPLATLSSIGDPVGIGVRTGNVADSFRAIYNTVRAIAKTKGIERIRGLAYDLGLAEEYLSNQALMQLFGTPDMSKGATVVNEKFFKWIGLTQLTQGSRIAAVAAAERFIIQHMTKPETHSARYMEELNLKRSDVNITGNKIKILTSEERSQLLRDNSSEAAKKLARDDRVRDAILRFVDESILRPDPSQRPLWMSDPNFSLISQYKSFVYAFTHTILRRVQHETQHGNYNALMASIAFVPMMMIAEILREFIQYGTGGDPRREKWSMDNYMVHATRRAGLMGPHEFALDATEDYHKGRLPGSSFMGPTLSQTKQLAQGQQDLLDVLPGAALFNDW